MKNGFNLSDADKITSSIWLILFHFFCVRKTLNIFDIRSFSALKKRKIINPYMWNLFRQHHLT